LATIGSFGSEDESKSSESISEESYVFLDKSKQRVSRFDRKKVFGRWEMVAFAAVFAGAR
jgi:hypothetical protein